jgi:hypothetical protein
MTTGILLVDYVYHAVMKTYYILLLSFWNLFSKLFQLWFQKFCAHNAHALFLFWAASFLLCRCILHYRSCLAVWIFSTLIQYMMTMVSIPSLQASNPGGQSPLALLPDLNMPRMPQIPLLYPPFCESAQETSTLTPFMNAHSRKTVTKKCKGQ